jgi:hypothetical protein
MEQVLSSQEIMQKYNGSGNLAIEYGKATNKYYEAFKEYNERKTL